ncbi:MAG TPA: NAD(P)/FAD-dependent oxidoreductase [Chitinivibrionales bacterium]|nr:NAD(P)/FAD-dependent oxidoreductase [Chitinivibrionales bacterium]
MEQSHITIIGAGVVGLAVAARLSKKHKDIIVLEQHDGFGRETSSRNSEVIHAGFYYPADSLKARLCVAGNHLLYELCAANNIPHNKIGKIVIANSVAEQEKVHSLFEQGKKNGVPDLGLLSKQQVLAMEPNIRAELGLHSPSTGIVDTHALMKYFEAAATARSVTMGYNCSVKAVQKIGEGYLVTVRDADGEEMEIASEIVINCAGLSSDKIAATAGIDVAKRGYAIHPCKGEYFSVSNRHRGKLSRLVYPAPTPISLGIHAVLKLDGSFKLGPNAFYVDKIDYDVDPSHRRDFFQTAKGYLPFLEMDDLSPDQSGIRPKIQAEGEGFKDFIIREERDKRLPGFIDLIGIESPGLTAAPAMAEHVGDMVDGL